MANKDIAIIGGGLAGMVLALALQQRGQSAKIYDARSRGAAQSEQRILALSQGSQNLLQTLGVWAPLQAAGAVTPILSIEVSQRAGLGRTLIRAQEENVPALGYTVRAGALAAALDAAIEAAGIAFFAQHTIAADAASAATTAALTVHAEGRVEAAANAVCQHDYRQSAVMCALDCAQKHGGRAWERFTPEGPVAFLPLAGASEMALVMTVATTQAADIVQMSDAEFLALLSTRLGSRSLPQAIRAGARHAVPLALRFRRTIVAPRAVWIGNAAQTLHPVAGQGFNLALRDIFELAHIVSRAPDPGAAAVLARYSQSRQWDRLCAMGFTDTLVRVFSHTWPLTSAVRGAALLALDVLPPLRTFLARRLMYGARA